MGGYETAARTHYFTQRAYLKTNYHPAESIEFAAPIWSTLRLPRADQPGFAWDGPRVADLRNCLAALGRECAPDPARAVEIELVPVDVWQPPAAPKRRSRVKPAAQV